VSSKKSVSSGGVDEEGGVAAPMTRDFAIKQTNVARTTTSVRRKVQSIPIKAPAQEHESVWQRTMKVTATALSKMGGKR